MSLKPKLPVERAQKVRIFAEKLQVGSRTNPGKRTSVKVTEAGMPDPIGAHTLQMPGMELWIWLLPGRDS